MTYGAYIVSLLSGDTTLSALLTGGVYLFQDSGRNGLNRIQNLPAFNKQTGLLKPICIIYEAQSTPTNEAVDMSTGFYSTITPITGWIYDNGNKGFDTIDTAAQRMYVLLHGARIPSGFQALWKGTLKNRREPLLQDASSYQFLIHVHGFMKFS